MKQNMPYGNILYSLFLTSPRGTRYICWIQPNRILVQCYQRCTTQHYMSHGNDNDPNVGSVHVTATLSRLPHANIVNSQRCGKLQIGAAVLMKGVICANMEKAGRRHHVYVWNVYKEARLDNACLPALQTPRAAREVWYALKWFQLYRLVPLVIINA